MGSENPFVVVAAKLAKQHARDEEARARHYFGAELFDLAGAIPDWVPGMPGGTRLIVPRAQAEPVLTIRTAQEYPDLIMLGGMDKPDPAWGLK